ncbi:MAG TPA: CHAD domain-containing protein [Polyangiaceae bacterium]|nr:CHAD domain-containing protein [Polyangiaceae bacterium]
MPALVAEGPARAAIANAIDAQSQRLATELAATAKRPKRGRVHRLRVATRRLLAALRLASAAGSAVPKVATKRLEKLLEALSPLRDAQVMESGLKALPEGEVEAAVLERAARERRRQRARTAKRLARFDASELIEAIGSVQVSMADGASPQPTLLGGLALTGHLAREQLTIEVGRARARQLSPHELHQLRLLLKSYRYSLEILAEQLSPTAAGLLETTTQLQDELGAAHDSEVLAKAVTEYAEAHDRNAQRLSESLARTSREAHARAAERLARAELRWPLGPEPQPAGLSRTKSPP